VKINKNLYLKRYCNIPLQSDQTNNLNIYFKKLLQREMIFYYLVIRKIHSFLDEARDISIMFGVTSVPIFIFYSNGEMHSKDTGYMSKEALKARIEDFIQSV